MHHLCDVWNAELMGRISGNGSCVVEEGVADFSEERDSDDIQGCRRGGNGCQILWFCVT